METITNQGFEREPLTEIDGAALIRRPKFFDARGSFSEISRAEGKVFPTFVQHNTTFCYANVLRGMHLQRDRPQGKLVTCVYGAILDVLFDLRPESPTYLCGFAWETNFHDDRSIYAPPGVAHGYLALSRFSVINYSCTTTYDPSSDGGINWADPALADLWPKLIDPVVSDKDRALPSLAEYREQYLKEDQNDSEQEPDQT